MLMGNKPMGTIAYMGGVHSVHELFCWSISQMVQYNAEYLAAPGQCVHYDHAQVSYHAYARNSLAERMRGDWLLMLDTDHSFDPDLAARMVHRMIRYNLDVLVGIYLYRNPPHFPVLYRWNPEGEGSYEVIGSWDGDPKVFEVGSAGAGCLLVRRSVFDRIRLELGESPFDISPPFSEDHSFFNRLRKLEIKAYCDPTIECNHLAVKSLSLKDYDSSEIQLSPKHAVAGFS